jgi:hypothetical protein
MTTIDMAGAAAAATGSGSPYVRRVQVPGPAVRAGVRACSRPTSTARPRPGRRALPRFAANHKVLGASNTSKLLSHLPVADRCETVVSITYEAQARLRDGATPSTAASPRSSLSSSRSPSCKRSWCIADQGAARVRRPGRRAFACEPPPPVAGQRQHQCWEAGGGAS